MDEVPGELHLGSLVPGTDLGLIVAAMPAETGTYARGEPLAEIDFRTETDLAEDILGRIGGVGTGRAVIEDGVDTAGDGDERVVKGTVGLIGTTDDLAVFIAVVVLLRRSVEGEKETCGGKDSENSLKTFHRLN